MTNMTFTKGIGSPTYMSPEILNKDKYKMPADIYSFSITMYEIITWQIAEFVTNGNRLEMKDCIPQQIGKIIQQSWCQNPKERLLINDIVAMLDTYSLQSKQLIFLD